MEDLCHRYPGYNSPRSWSRQTAVKLGIISAPKNSMLNLAHSSSSRQKVQVKNALVRIYFLTAAFAAEFAVPQGERLVSPMDGVSRKTRHPNYDCQAIAQRRQPQTLQRVLVLHHLGHHDPRLIKTGGRDQRQPQPCPPRAMCRQQRDDRPRDRVCQAQTRISGLAGIPHGAPPAQLVTQVPCHGVGFRLTPGPHGTNKTAQSDIVPGSAAAKLYTSSATVPPPIAASELSYISASTSSFTFSRSPHSEADPVPPRVSCQGRACLAPDRKRMRRAATRPGP